MGEEDPIIFSLFLTWLVTGDLTKASEYVRVDRADPSEIKSERHDAQFMQFLQAYVLGDVLQAEDFCNWVMDFMV